MIFGVLKDIKNGEYRVIATPAEVRTLRADGHEVLVQRGAGAGAALLCSLSWAMVAVTWRDWGAAASTSP